MLARSVVRVTTAVSKTSVRTMSIFQPQCHGNWTRKMERPADLDKDVVVPELADTLEWLLTCPTPVHQFEEPPIIIEVEHLKNLKTPAH